MIKVMLKKQTGFTIVELLIVIVVIGILAAITIVAYNGVQNRANDTTVKNDLSSMARQVVAFHAINGRYPTQSQFFTGHNDIKISVAKQSYDEKVYNLYYCTDAGTGERFGIASRSKSGQTFTISSTEGIVKVAQIPSWNAACGAFGETDLPSIEFSYGYVLTTKTWRAAL